MDKKNSTRTLTKNEKRLRQFAEQLRSEQKISGRYSPISAENAKFVLQSIDNYFRSQGSRRPIDLHRAFQLRSAGNPGKSEQESIAGAEQALQAWRVQFELEEERIAHTGKPRSSGHYYTKDIMGRIGWQHDEKSLRALMNNYRVSALAQILNERLSR